jgi:uncharacterized lipoprotein YmbA
MMRRRSSLSVVLFLSLLTAVAGCLSVQTRASREYVLSWHGEVPEDFQRAAPSEPRGSTIAIGPVIVPTYLQRTGIVTRIDENQINASSGHTWGEALEAGVARILVESVAHNTGANRVAGLPWPFPGAPDLRVAVEVLSFEYDQLDSDVDLVARWTVMAGPRGQAKLLRREILSESVEGDSIPTIVSGMSRLVMELGLEISKDLQSLEESMDAAAADDESDG